MSSIFPIRDKVSLDRQGEPRLVDLDEETADEVFEALASQTTREIFLELYNQPQTASDLADVTDTSVQNVQYHLEKLTDAELVEVVDTWYSERGSEMKVYAPEDESLVLFAGRDKHSTLRKLLNRVVGVLALLLPPSILVGWITNQTTSTSGPDGDLYTDGGDAGGDGQSGAAQPTEEQADAPSGNGDGGYGNGNGNDAGGNGNGDGASGAGTDSGAAGDGNGAGREEDATETVEQAAETQSFTSGDGNELADNATVRLNDSNLTETVTPENIADSANATVDTVAGLDPGIAAALAFFFGGLFVFAILSVWSPGIR